MRDVILTMSNRQSLAVPINANLSATDSTSVIPNPTGTIINPDAAMWWVLLFSEETGTPIQVEGTLNAELQFSVDGGSTYRTADGVEVELSDPALPASGSAERKVAVGRRLRQDLAVADLTLVRFKTVYTTTGRVMGDGAATVRATSHLTIGAAA